MQKMKWKFTSQFLFSNVSSRRETLEYLTNIQKLLIGYCVKWTNFIHVLVLHEQGFKNQKSWYTFFHAHNNIFVYTIMHLTFCAPQIVIHAHVCTIMYQAMHVLQRWKYFRAEVNLRSILLLTINPEPSLGIQTVYYRKRSNRHIFGHIIIQYFLLGLGEKERIMSLASTI